MMRAMSKLHVFKAGKHVSAAGDSLEFTQADIDAIAASYDPKVYKAPIVIGHPKTEDAAFGWIGALSAAGADLYAEPEQVEPQFAEMVNAGRFRNISVALWPKGHTSSPKKDAPYLKHVGFLGATAPAVKGLTPASFAADDDKIVTFEFSATDDSAILEKIKSILFPKSTSERLTPAHFSASKENTDMATQAEIDARAAELLTKENALKVKETQFAEREDAVKKEIARAAVRSSNVEFAEKLAKEGRILPQHKNAVIETLTALHGAGEVEFSEDDGKTKVKKSPADALRAVLETAKPLIDFAEKSSGDVDRGNAITPKVPQGFGVDKDRAAQDAKIQEYADKNKVTYLEAVRALKID